MGCYDKDVKVDNPVCPGRNSDILGTNLCFIPSKIVTA